MRNNPTGGLGGEFVINQDSRLLNSSILPPGYPLLKTTGNKWVLMMQNWVESNVY
jgi:hypothetical protein